VGTAGVRVAVATAALPTGIVNFMETSMSCKDLATRWWVFDSVGEDPRRLTTKVWDFQGNVIGSAARQAVAELSTTSDVQFYLTLRTSEQGLALEFGTGDGASDRSRFPLTSAVDPNFKGSLDSISRISFSSNTNFDILYTNIQPCSGIEQPIPTSSPTVNSNAGGQAPPSRLGIKRNQRNKFVLWPQGWSKPSESISSCFQFMHPMSRSAGRTFIALATGPLGISAQFNRVPQGVRAHVLAITRNTVHLYRDGKLINAQYIVPAIAVPNRGTRAMWFRAQADETGKITLDMQLPSANSWTRLYEYTDPAAGFIGTRFSVSSSTARVFSRIAVCNAGDA